MRGRDQEATQDRIATLGDPELGISAARLRASGHEPEVGADAPTRAEPPRILEGEHVAEGRQRTHAGDLTQRSSFGMRGSGEDSEAPVGGGHRRGQRGDGIERRLQRCAEGGGERRADLSGKGATSQRARDRLAQGVERALHVVDQERPGPHHRVTRPQLGAVPLRRRLPVGKSARGAPGRTGPAAPTSRHRRYGWRSRSMVRIRARESHHTLFERRARRW